MREPRDPMRSLFQQAARSVQDRTVTAPVRLIAERGRKAHRRRVALLTASACLALFGSGAAVVAWLPVTSPPALPAKPGPSSQPSPVESSMPSATPPADRSGATPSPDPSRSTPPPATASATTTMPPHGSATSELATAPGNAPDTGAVRTEPPS
ncbi:hypothetical protein ACFPM3_18550 [Streptomyces coeruleoprunus]|uniref:Uncharacterized protein n=1 Tax=Streptomyces coeruleoprunus TaxID=285563 RepID=A0ABV9XGK1_9ACTN